MSITPIFTRIEIDLPPHAADLFGMILREYNAKTSTPFTPSELAASILVAVLGDDCSAHDRQ